MFSVMYNSFIQPLIFLMEAILQTAFSYTGNYGVSLILLSITVNILIIPFYGLADSWQREEKGLLKKISKKKDEIKAVFKGDEQYFYLKTLYRQNGYNPLMAVRSSFGLLIQIPFFIAAYRFLSHFQPLQQQSFAFLNDLSQPDGIFGFINVMPFLMTAINLTSAFVFSRDMSKRERYQLYGMATLFLVLLYNAPAGLLLYWTCNNLVSLIKNILKGLDFSSYWQHSHRLAEKLYRLIKLPNWCLIGIFLYAFGSVILYYLFKSFGTVIMVKVAYPPMLYLAILALLYYIISFRTHFFYQISVFLMLYLWSDTIRFILRNPFIVNPKNLLLNLFYICGAALFFPFVEWINSYLERNQIIMKKDNRRLLYTAISILVLLAGMAIPSSLVASSPGEIGFSASLLGQSFFWSLLWLCAVLLFLYYAAPDALRKPLTLFIVVIAIVTVTNFLLFPGDYGVISDSLQFEFGGVKDSKKDIVLNLGISGFIGLLVIILFVKKRTPWINSALSILMVALIALSVVNTFKIMNHDKGSLETAEILDSISPRIAFSRDKPNTVILFLDRSLAGAIPSALEKLPHLKEDFDGFTWYSNTLSFGTNTITSLPAMLGGYDYSPQGMLSRPEKTLKEKVMESWTILPGYFLEMDNSVYIANPHFHDYKIDENEKTYLSDMDVTLDRLYDVYTEKWLTDHELPSDFGRYLLRDKSIFVFSLFRMAPLFYREELYDNGTWHSIVADEETYRQISNLPKARDLLKEWSSLDYLPELSHTNADTATFSFIGNNATHEVLAIDDTFKPSVSQIDYPEDDLQKYGSVASIGHIYTNIAVLDVVSEWLQWMKEEGIYDNTQIVITADHGRAREGVYNPFFHNVGTDEKSPDYNGYHPLLMFKPFDSRGTLGTSREFMTNADVPSLVLKAFGEFNNPYTGNPINGSAKKEPLLVGDGPVEIYKHLKNEYLYYEKYFVSGSMLDPSSWSVAK